VPIRSLPRPRGRSLVGVLSILALAALTAACAGLPTARGHRVTHSTESPRATPSGSSLEGRFSYDQMDQYVDAVVPMITAWTHQTWPDQPDPARVVYVPHAASGPEGCRDSSGRLARYSARSYEYCGSDGRIYVGQDMLWSLYTEAGDAGPAVGLAHEWGHHIQSLVGVPAPESAAEAVGLEDQADCIAGAWTRFTDQQGWLEYPDDIEDIEALFPLIGSAEGPGRDHGTTPERVDSFNIGWEGGVAGCNEFYPDTPLVG
jgi:predicted metalloprotease